MNRNQTIIAVLNNAISYLWDGVPRYYDKYRDNPGYMCHAVEFAIAQVVYGDRNKPIYINHDSIGTELAQKIRAKIPGYSTADSYCRNRGIYGDLGIQAFRKQVLREILAEYQAREPQAIKASELAREAIKYVGLNDDEIEYGSGKYKFTCHAVDRASIQLSDKGKKGANVAKEVVKQAIMDTMGINASQIGTTGYDDILKSLLGRDHVKSLGTHWMQTRRVEMLERIAVKLEAEGK